MARGGSIVKALNRKGRNWIRGQVEQIIIDTLVHDVKNGHLHEEHRQMHFRCYANFTSVSHNTLTF